MKIDLISVHYNNPGITEKFLTSILNQDSIGDFDIKVYLVDNASDQKNLKSLEIIIKSFSDKLDIILIKNKENLGYFSGMNKGLVKSTSRHTPYKIISNNDIQFKQDFLIVLKGLFFEKECFVIYPDVISSDGMHQNPRVINSISNFRKLSYKLYFANYFFAFFINLFIGFLKNEKELNRKGFKNEMKIHLGVGACMVLASSFLSKIKKLDDRVFLWGEEVLLSNQVKEEGGYQYYFPKLKIFHSEHSTVSKFSSKKKYDLMKVSYKIYKNYL